MKDEYSLSNTHHRRSLDSAEHQQAMETLLKNNKHLNNLFNYASAPILVWDADFIITRLNNAFEALTGIPACLMIGTNVATLFSYEQLERSLDLISATYAGAHWDSVEIPIIHIDGSLKIVLWNSSTIFDEDGVTPVATIAQGIDITERTRIEDELRQAKIAAESANKAKSAFLATMSHEIRTPLNALTGNLTLLSTTSLTGLQQKCMRDCTSASQMLLRVINDILDFSKIEAGKITLIKESFSPAKMLNGLVSIYTARAEEKQLRLNLEVLSFLPDFILGDRQRLSQIISNLLSNAIKFTKQGEVMLSVSTSFEDDYTIKLVLSVSDSGIGIPPEEQPSVFESFTQLENFSTRRNVGTGLGLAISKRLVEMMEGEIFLTSTPGVGTTFTLTIPVTLSESPTRAIAKKQIRATARKVLLADDEPIGREIATALLERNGHSVVAVEDGATILEMMQRERFDILLTDISMPDMDGIQVVQIIRSGERKGIDPLTPIIALTAHAFPEDRERFLCCGMNDYISKPINFEELLGLIEENCGNVE